MCSCPATGPVLAQGARLRACEGSEPTSFSMTMLKAYCTGLSALSHSQYGSSLELLANRPPASSSGMMMTGVVALATSTLLMAAPMHTPMEAASTFVTTTVAQ